MKDQLVVITGASSGIGAALAEEAAARGARLALSDVNPDAAKAWLKRSGAKGAAHKLDVSRKDDFEAYIEQVTRDLGPVDVMINNAGVGLSATVAEMSIEDFRWVMDINFWGVVYGTQAVLPAMMARKKGTIVNISSLFGLISVPTQSAYNASKFAVRGFTESLRAELSGTGVNALCVHPGGIKTNIARNSRFSSAPNGADDKAAAVKDFDKIARVQPEQAAKEILEAVRKGRSRLLIGNDARLFDLVQRGFPVRYTQAVNTLLSLTRR